MRLFPLAQDAPPPVLAHGQERDQHVQARRDGGPPRVILPHQIHDARVSLPARHDRASDGDHEVLIRALHDRVHASAAPSARHRVAQLSRLHAVRVVHDVPDAFRRAELRHRRDVVAPARGEARGARDHAHEIVRAAFGRVDGALDRGDVGDELVAAKQRRDDDQLEARADDGFHARLLVEAAPDDLPGGLRALLAHREEDQGEGHARGEGEDQGGAHVFHAGDAHGVGDEEVGELREERGARRLGLLRGDVAAAPDAVREVPVPPGDEGGEDAALALAHADVVEEVVAVHRGGVRDERLDGGVVPPGLREATRGEEGDEQLRAARASLRTLRDVRAGDEALGEGERLGGEHDVREEERRDADWKEGGGQEPKCSSNSVRLTDLDVVVRRRLRRCSRPPFRRAAWRLERRGRSAH